MNNFSVRPLSTRSDLIKFIKSQWNFYKGDPNWVPPMIAERIKLLDSNKNPFFQHSLMQLFIAEAEGKIVGRIAAIINDNHNKTHNDKVGFFGFFECIDDQEVAKALFDAAGDWLMVRGMDHIRGPVNPSLNDECFMLVDGFNEPATVLMSYNPEYYPRITEASGFKKAKDAYAYTMTPETYITDKMLRVKKLVTERHKVNIRSVVFNDKKQFQRDTDILKKIYNDAWMPNWGHVKATNAEFEQLTKDLKPIAEPQFTLIAEMDGKPVGFALGLPDINQCLIHNKKGGMLGAVWHLMTKKSKISTLRIIVLGVLPEYQKTGIDSLLYLEFCENAKKRGIKNGEASWILEDNEGMNRALTKTMNAKIYRTYRMYEKELS